MGECMSYLVIGLSSGFLVDASLAFMASVPRLYPFDNILVFKPCVVDDWGKEISMIQDRDTKPTVKHCLHRRLTIGLQKNHFIRSKRGHSHFHARAQKREQRISSPRSQSCGRRNGGRKKYKAFRI